LSRWTSRRRKEVVELLRLPSRSLRQSRALNGRKESWTGEGVGKIDERRTRRRKNIVAVGGRGKGGRARGQRKEEEEEEERSWRVSSAEDGSLGGCCWWRFEGEYKT